jgi:hypothetical protein
MALILASDLISNSLRFLGALAVGETASSAELSDGLLVLNELIASFSAEQATLYTRTSETVALTTAQTYTWGAGGTWTTARPLRLLAAESIYQGVYRPVDIISYAEWQGIPERAVTGNVVQKLYLDNAYPLATASLWPKPTSSSTSLELVSLKALAGFTNLTDSVDFPPGYERALRFALALDLAPEYGRPITPELVGLATQAKASIVALNKANYAGLDGTDTGAAPAIPAGQDS